MEEQLAIPSKSGLIFAKGVYSWKVIETYVYKIYKPSLPFKVLAQKCVLIQTINYQFSAL